MAPLLVDSWNSAWPLARSSTTNRRGSRDTYSPRAPASQCTRQTSATTPFQRRQRRSSITVIPVTEEVMRGWNAMGQMPSLRGSDTAARAPAEARPFLPE